MSKQANGRRRGLPERLEIRNWCLDQFTACRPYWRIEVELARKFGCHRRTAQRYIAEARTAFAKRDRDTIEERRDLALLQLEEAYRVAHAKGDSRGMTQAVVHRCHLEGLLGRFATSPGGIAGTFHPGCIDDEFDSRSMEDLDFYLAHHCWPEEMPKALPTATSNSASDPLAGLG